MHVAPADLACAGMHMTTDTPGSRLKRLRSELGLTQEEVAQRGGLDRSSVVKLERGVTQGRSGPMREGLARGFGLTVEDVAKLLDGRLTPKAAAVLARTPHQAAPLPPETVMDADPGYVPAPGRSAHEFSHVLTDAFRAGHGDAEDFDEVRRVVVQAGDLHVTDPGQLSRLAVRLLNASKRLRAKGLRVSWVTLMVELGVNVRPLDDEEEGDGAPPH